MKRGALLFALAGFLLGSTTQVGGRVEQNEELRDQLTALQAAVEQVAPGAGCRFERIYIGDLPHDPLKPVYFLLRALDIEERLFRSAGDWLFVYQRPDVLARVHAFLDLVRARTHRCVCVEARIRDRFHARALGRTGQWISLTHGAQNAIHGDPEVEVAKDNGQTTDPIIEILQEGGLLTVRVCLGENPTTARVELDFQHRDLERPMRKLETAVNGELDLPAVERRECRTDLIVPAGRWIEVARGIELKVTATSGAPAR